MSEAICKRPAGRAAFLLVLATFAAAGGGCTRNYYRNQADREVNDILAEKDKYPFWQIEQFHVYPDPRARFADPTNPDRPPMPPDDEAAYKLSPHPQAPYHSGVGDVQGTAYLEMVKIWDEQNRAQQEAAGADTLSPAAGTGAASGDRADTRVGPIKTFFDEPLKAELRGFLLSLDQAVELGVVNSRQYQSFREGLYSTALPVTLQRFSFAYQWTAMIDAVRTSAGPLSPVDPTIWLRGLLTADVPRKNVEAMALRLVGAGPDAARHVRALQQFIGEGAWDDAALLAEHQRLVAASLGFDHVLIGAPFQPGRAGHGQIVADHDRLHPVFDTQQPASEALHELAEEVARQLLGLVDIDARHAEAANLRVLLNRVLRLHPERVNARAVRKQEVFLLRVPGAAHAAGFTDGVPCWEQLGVVVAV